LIGRREVRWHCRRGMKELDVLLERFLASGYEQASLAQKHAFAALLALPDPQMAAYLFGHATPADTPMVDIVKLITGGRT
jgi:antitoxin CptB